MSYLDLASIKSIWKGVDYYLGKKVLSWEEFDDGTCQGKVSGSDTVYDVNIDLIHPRKSKCTCPFADGRRVICKHMVAVYFSSNPISYKEFMNQVEQCEQEEQERELQHYEDIRTYVNSLKKEQLREELFEALVELEEYKKNRW